MKITDIKEFPVRVMLTSGFTLDDSYDENMIIQINSYEQDDDEVYDNGGRCFKVYTTVLPEDVAYNKSVAKPIWYDKNSNPVLDYFEANPEKKKSDGSYRDTIWVMENDDFCELVHEKKIERKWRGEKNFDWDKFKKFVNTYDPTKDSFDDFCIVEDMVYGLGIALSDKYRWADGFRKFLVDLNGQFVEKYNTKKA